jgi:hypothetical protein
MNKTMIDAYVREKLRDYLDDELKHSAGDFIEELNVAEKKQAEFITAWAEACDRLIQKFRKP